MSRCLILFAAVVVPGLVLASDSRYFEDIPDFTQTEIKGRAFGNGQQFCGPVAVSNSLAWLSRKRIEQRQLITLLASEPYMNTNLKNGTGTSGLLRGINRYTQEYLGDYRSLEYQGWRKHPRQFATGKRVPTLPFIARGATRRSAAWLNIGWYRVNTSAKAYERFGGHWVTLVGYDFGKGQLIINDPAPRAGSGKSSQRVSFRTLSGGQLTGAKSGLPTSADGYLQLGAGLARHRKADTAIVDGVVLLEL